MKRSSNIFDNYNEPVLPNKKLKTDDIINYSYLLIEINMLKMEIISLKNSLNEIIKNTKENIQIRKSYCDKPCSYIS